MASLEKEFKYYLAHRKALIKKYGDRYLVVKNEEVIGVYSSREEAIKETMGTHKLGTFLVQYADTKHDNTSQTFYSRIVFSAN